jgi:hypothetical protein
VGRLCLPLQGYVVLDRPFAFKQWVEQHLHKIPGESPYSLWLCSALLPRAPPCCACTYRRAMTVAAGRCIASPALLNLLTFCFCIGCLTQPPLLVVLYCTALYRRKLHLDGRTRPPLHPPPPSVGHSGAVSERAAGGSTLNPPPYLVVPCSHLCIATHHLSPSSPACLPACLPSCLIYLFALPARTPTCLLLLPPDVLQARRLPLLLHRTRSLQVHHRPLQPKGCAHHSV